jgi:hypothetical protein
MARLAFLAPELYAGCPQHVWVAGTTTSQPADSNSRAAENATFGRIVSARQVTKSATFGFAEFMARNYCPSLGEGMRAAAAVLECRNLHGIVQKLLSLNPCFNHRPEFSPNT